MAVILVMEEVDIVLQMVVVAVALIVEQLNQTLGEAVVASPTVLLTVVAVVVAVEILLTVVVVSEAVVVVYRGHNVQVTATASTVAIQAKYIYMPQVVSGGSIV